MIDACQKKKYITSPTSRDPKAATADATQTYTYIHLDFFVVVPPLNFSVGDISNS
jgi:hypothetical protein